MVFNVVLLDPNHNIQPADYYDHKIRPCFPMESQFESISKDIGELNEACITQCHAECQIKDRLPSLVESNHSFGMLYVDEENYDMAKALVREGHFTNVGEILRLGIQLHNDTLSPASAKNDAAKAA